MFDIVEEKPGLGWLAAGGWPVVGVAKRDSRKLSVSGAIGTDAGNDDWNDFGASGAAVCAGAD